MSQSPTPLTAEQTAALLPYGALSDEIGAVLRANAAGTLHVPERTVVDLPRGTLLSMPASDADLAIVKVVTVHPGNAGSELPTISGEVIVASAADGRRLGILHGGTVTGRRTAALSLLAARELRRDERWAAAEGPLLVIGAGTQGRTHAEALAELPGVEEIVVASRTIDRARELAEHLNRQGHSATAIPPSGADFDRAVGAAAVVVTATTSERPVLKGGLRPDAIVCAVGAYRHDMAELGAEVVATAGDVYVDSLAGAKDEAGDLIAAALQGDWSWDLAVPLIDLLLDEAPQPVAAKAGHAVFKSVGHALYDLAAARVAFPK